MKKIIPSYTVENCKDCRFGFGFEPHCDEPSECCHPDMVDVDLSDYYYGGIPYYCPLEDA